MNVLFVTAEMTPLAKVGGLADVAGSLPRALGGRGVDVRVVLPLHEGIPTAQYGFVRRPDTVAVPTPRGPEAAGVWEGAVAGVPVYLIEAADLFERPNVYGEPDDLQRWLFFCDAVLACLPDLGWRPDVLHLNDWHAGFIASRLRGGESDRSRVPLVFTIHNLALKGDFDDEFAEANDLRVPDDAAGLDRRALSSGMAQGILHADVISTVSPTYAREIRTPRFGAGLDPLLRARSRDVYGILNGIDLDELNPATDPHLPARFSVDDPAPRIAAREALQARAKLLPDGTPIAAMVTRLFRQKGADIAVDAAANLLKQRVPLRLVVLGTGEERYHRQLMELHDRFPESVRLFFTFDPQLSPVIYGGSDLFLMPSRYEPCGLGQMIAMRYGSVPVVARTGGLADTVTDADEHPDTGQGFVFDPPAADAPAEAAGRALAGALRRALTAYADPPRWRAIQRRGMLSDFSWQGSAERYVALYEAAMERAATPAANAPGRAFRGCAAHGELPESEHRQNDGVRSDADRRD